MHKILLSMVCVFSSQAFSADSKFLIHQGGVGDLQIGGKPESVYSQFDKSLTQQVDLSNEGLPSPAIQVYLNSDDLRNSAPALTVELNGSEIWRFTVRSPVFKTAEGVHVGSTFGLLEKKYRGLERMKGEGNTCAVTEILHYSFCTSVEKFTERAHIETILVTK